MKKKKERIWSKSLEEIFEQLYQITKTVNVVGILRAVSGIDVGKVDHADANIGASIFL